MNSLDKQESTISLGWIPPEEAFSGNEQEDLLAIDGTKEIIDELFSLGEYYVITSKVTGRILFNGSKEGLDELSLDHITATRGEVEVHTNPNPESIDQDIT
ncbi:MAG: hypothetical protein WD061_00135 [Candidatus Saccharimonadales bacterium]